MVLKRFCLLVLTINRTEITQPEMEEKKSGRANSDSIHRLEKDFIKPEQVPGASSTRLKNFFHAASPTPNNSRH